MWLFWIWIIQLSARTSSDNENRHNVCRFGSDEGCLFECLCSNGCDRDTGTCLDGGKCPEGRPKGHPNYGVACLIGNVVVGMVATQTGLSDNGLAYLAIDGDTEKTCANPTAPTDNDGSAARWSVKLEKRLHVYDVIIYYNINVGLNDAQIAKDFWVTRDVGAEEVACRLTTTHLQRKTEQFTCDDQAESIHIYHATNMILCEVVVMATEVSIARGIAACQNHRCAAALVCLFDEERFDYHSCVKTRSAPVVTKTPLFSLKHTTSLSGHRTERDVSAHNATAARQKTTTLNVPFASHKLAYWEVKSRTWISLFIVLAFLIMCTSLLVIAGLTKIRLISHRDW